MKTIESVKARQIFDSRGNPTLECDVVLSDGSFGRAAVPSGASVGGHEAVELRDGEGPFGGKGVLKAVKNVNEKISAAVIGMDAGMQEEIDKKMLSLDGTKDKSILGANATLGVSLAVARAFGGEALYKHIGALFGNDKFTLPVPMMNVLNGGAHANNGQSIQEFMIVPQAETFADRMRVAAEVFQKLKYYIGLARFSTAVGDEGGFAPKIGGAIEALDLIMHAAEGYDIKIALDVAATEFYDGEFFYNFEGMNATRGAMIDTYKKLCDKFPIASIEDPFAEDDDEGWKMMVAQFGKDRQIVGDDLFCTDVARIKKGVEGGLANAVLIKPNQIGTLTETLAAIKYAKDNGFNTVISHRSGETEDTFIADLAVGTNAGQIKTGGVSRGERMCKYNRLIRIEEELK
ncbi:MAG: phosphopyruvate hydratase [Rickettsiales bacterium]|jgi:enolase|nr:phosphopyruvate hydratase [Rickettsiales bacterium]